MQEGLRHPTEIFPHLSTWLRSVSSFLISHDCFQGQACQSSKFQIYVSARIWLCVCFQAQWPWPELFFMWFLATRFGWSQLSSIPAPAAEMLNFPEHRESKDGSGPSWGSPPAHTGVKGEGFPLGQSRHTASLKQSHLLIFPSRFGGWHLPSAVAVSDTSSCVLGCPFPSHTTTRVCFGWKKAALR